LNKTIFISCSSGNNPVSKQFDALISELISLGYQVVRLIDGQKKELEKKGNPGIYTWPSKRPTKLKDALFFYQLVKQYQPSVIISNFGAVNIATLIGYVLGVPLRVAWYHTVSTQRKYSDGKRNYFSESFQMFRKRIIYGLSTFVITNSNATNIDLIRNFKIQIGKTKVFYNLLEDPLNKEFDIKNKDKEIIFACPGRLDYLKGQDVLLNSIKVLDNKNVHVYIIGEGKQKKKLIEMSKEFKISENTHFLGRLSHDELMEFLKKTYCVIVPSRDEAFGYVNIEAMSVEVPVIASSVGGIPEIIRDGIDGFLFSPEDSLDLAEKIKFLIDNPDIRNQMGKNARERFLMKFELKRNIGQMAGWFDNEIKKLCC